jgi:ABC-type branched-subunit amino acid transport system ATPase component
MSSALVEARNVTKVFGGVRALDNVSFEAPEGSVTAVIGPNGAGKTTLFNCMTGFSDPTSGSVLFRTQVVSGRPAHEVARAGMIRTFQSIKMLSGLTVYESLLCARPRKNTPVRLLADRLLTRLQLTEVADRTCTELPLLAQRKIEVARALMTEPELLMLDEPSAGATVAERQELADLVIELRASGTAVMVIEHNVPFVLQVSDHIVVLNFGKVVAAGTPAEISANPVVQEIYLGV